MAKYRVLMESCIGGSLRQAGDVIEDYDAVKHGEPSHNLELIKEKLPNKKDKPPAAPAGGDKSAVDSGADAGQLSLTADAGEQGDAGSESVGAVG